MQGKTNSHKEIKIWAFGCVMENNSKNDFQCLVTFWKCYFPTNFSHFPSFQTNFILENPPPPTHHHPQKIHHYPHKTHHHITQKPPKHHHPHHHNNNNKKSEIKERKIERLREREIDRERENGLQWQRRDPSWVVTKMHGLRLVVEIKTQPVLVGAWLAIGEVGIGCLWIGDVGGVDRWWLAIGDEGEARPRWWCR